MAVKYSQTSTFRQALGKTFDGQHPCGICKVVEQGKKSENKPVSLKVETKLDFCPPLAPSLLDLEPLLPLVVPPAESDWALARFESPPTPPPRLA